jgi:hypothetical protein
MKAVLSYYTPQDSDDTKQQTHMQTFQTHYTEVVAACERRHSCRISCHYIQSLPRSFPWYNGDTLLIDASCPAHLG